MDTDSYSRFYWFLFIIHGLRVLKSYHISIQHFQCLHITLCYVKKVGVSTSRLGGSNSLRDFCFLTWEQQAIDYLAQRTLKSIFQHISCIFLCTYANSHILKFVLYRCSVFYKDNVIVFVIPQHTAYSTKKSRNWLKTQQWGNFKQEHWRTKKPPHLTFMMYS